MLGAVGAGRAARANSACGRRAACVCGVRLALAGGHNRSCGAKRALLGVRLGALSHWGAMHRRRPVSRQETMRVVAE